MSFFFFFKCFVLSIHSVFCNVSTGEHIKVYICGVKNNGLFWTGDQNGEKSIQRNDLVFARIRQKSAKNWLRFILLYYICCFVCVCQYKSSALFSSVEWTALSELTVWHLAVSIVLVQQAAATRDAGSVIKCAIPNWRKPMPTAGGILNCPIHCIFVR